jgi:hypothetical protein
MSDEEVDVFASAETAQPDEGGVRRDRYGRYMIPKLPKLTAKGAFGAVGKGEVAWTRATTFAKAIADTFALNAWMQRMAIKGIAMREDLYALTAATPLENRKDLDAIVEDAKKAAGAKNAATLGTALHGFTEALDRGQQVTIPKPWQRDTTAYRALLAQYGLSIPAKAIERIVVVERFGVAGTFDRIAQLTQDITFAKMSGAIVSIPKGTWVILDLKTGRDLSYGWNEIAIQLYLYASADGIWNPETWRFEKMPAVSQDWALVVHLPVGNARAELIALDLSSVERAAELCYEVRNWRTHRTLTHSIGVAEAPPAPDLSAPVKEAVDPSPAEVAPGLDEKLAEAKAKADARKMASEVLGTQILADPEMVTEDRERDEPSPTLTVRPATWADKVLAATTKEELSALWKAGQAAGEWTDALTALGKEQLSKMQPSQK